MPVVSAAAKAIAALVTEYLCAAEVETDAVFPKQPPPCAQPKPVSGAADIPTASSAVSSIPCNASVLSSSTQLPAPTDGPAPTTAADVLPTSQPVSASPTASAPPSPFTAPSTSRSLLDELPALPGPIPPTWVPLRVYERLLWRGFYRELLVRQNRYGDSTFWAEELGKSLHSLGESYVECDRNAQTGMPRARRVARTMATSRDTVGMGWMGGGVEQGRGGEGGVRMKLERRRSLETLARGQDFLLCGELFDVLMHANLTRIEFRFVACSAGPVLVCVQLGQDGTVPPDQWAFEERRLAALLTTCANKRLEPLGARVVTVMTGV